MTLVPTARPTSVWVPVDRLIPHPDNDNRMTEEMFGKLLANVEQNDGRMPPVIVRSLELTQAFKTEFEAGKLQILDGEHRWLLAKKRGDSEIEVRIWPEINDTRAKLLLGTLNHIHGRSDPKRRSALIRSLHEVEPDPEALAALLPETAEQIVKTVSESSRAAVTDAQERARAITGHETITVFATPAQAELVRRAIKRWLDANDSDGAIRDCREGAALEGIARRYLETMND